MNENEQLARWLGWTPQGDGPWHSPGVSKGDAYVHETVSRLPDIRASNEWAGAVLKKLKPHVIGIDTVGTSNDWRVEIYDSPAFISSDWRSAVVDAALEVIRLETEKREHVREIFAK